MIHAPTARAGCGRVAMEAPGVYWKPVFNVLEICTQVATANAAQIKGTSGRKTDGLDAERIAAAPTPMEPGWERRTPAKLPTASI